MTAAQIVASMAIGEDEGAYCAGSEAEEQKLIARSAAMCNCLFDGEQNEKIRSWFDLAEIEHAAHMWLSQHDTFKELVVQSLRVMNTIAIDRAGAVTGLLGEGILSMYGKTYPDAPNPDNYPAIIRKALGELDDANRNELLRGFSKINIAI
ncbi:MAG: hypothetical protein ACRDHZ_23630 [Ktedonobacteraceae bacterium]